MKKQAGIWIDHKSAYIVIVGQDQDVTERIYSNVEKNQRSASEQHAADDQIERQFTEHIGGYYDEVIARVNNAESILIIGPGEAKGELKKRITDKGLAGRIVGVDAYDKMTDPQIVAIVRQHYAPTQAR